MLHFWWKKKYSYTQSKHVPLPLKNAAKQLDCKWKYQSGAVKIKGMGGHKKRILFANFKVIFKRNEGNYDGFLVHDVQAPWTRPWMLVRWTYTYNSTRICRSFCWVLSVWGGGLNDWVKQSSINYCWWLECVAELCGEGGGLRPGAGPHSPAQCAHTR